MDDADRFAGFTPQTLAFFRQLKRNNDRAWFNAHKDEYTRWVLEPARAFVIEMGRALSRICPGLVTDAGPNGSIFRIYRDTRFSSDKTPYKTHLGIYFWQAGAKKLDHPGFYFELDDDGMGLYAGWYIFPPEVLKDYRQAVADERLGHALLAARRRVEKAGLTLGGQSYKRVPRGFDVDEARGQLLRHSGLYTQLECGRPKELFSRSLVAHCARRWKLAMPIHQWLQCLVGR